MAAAAALMIMVPPLKPSQALTLTFPLIYKSSLKPSLTKMALHITASASASASAITNRKLPVLLFDIMDTIVRDPFNHDIPAFFGMSMKELLECKHPTAWIEFEKGLIDEMELERIFFKDGRHFDLEGYSYLEGVEELLCALKDNGYEMHAFTNYPIWYRMIEDKLKLSSYLSWTFCSCIIGKRKPDPDFYSEVLKHLDTEPKNCVFVDDRIKNVDAAKETGINGIQFKNADSLRHDLSLLGVTL
ncbi:HAD-like domain-containing protein [Cynara cardunculus var. scolymus]|uniref:HAD-like domain-containing protein n=1 Tax=Cynara cardunculus var. scolymus TaxID=59895 RepID=A0A103YED8_CYNCS|nr:HAD-like domain-containing protein [Cynara cardunculus var. scolymus]